MKILDFGIARLRAPSGQTSLVGLRAMGTPAYMPPEQARARWDLVDARTDLWALGATMFSLLTDRYVQEAPTVNELFFLRMTCPIPSLARVAPSMFPAVVRVVDRALEFAQADRWPDARSMLAALREAHAALALAPPRARWSRRPGAHWCRRPGARWCPPPRSTLVPPPPPEHAGATAPEHTGAATPEHARAGGGPARPRSAGRTAAFGSSPGAAFPDGGALVAAVARDEPACALDDSPRALKRA